ncbi:unnamed protein product [Paramecium primaurelia]|uniref:EGF-like domain-containing protein n=1 Tax=Paramecium primaurelia TaxID=5886 RepID=A0A8S1PKE5_PARPR|nr:unnamed protein product [Paramecium primaurelia]
MPLESSIELHINNTYYGKIYKNNTSVQTDNFILYANFNKPNYYESTQVYQNNQQYQIYLQANITKQFILKLIGNYTDINAGWAIRSIEISSGYCPSQCQTCSEKFKCTKCNTNYYISKWNQCVQCTSNFQIKINDTHCQDFDTTDATKYSRLLIKEFIGLEINPVTYSEYLVISQTGLNFLKGANIYYSILNKYQRIFGGPYIWAQARFSRQFNILDPHHSLSIAFIVVFGPSFQDNGKFIFWIDDTHMTELTKSSPSNKIFKQHQHSLTTLKLDWECQGLNNEPIEAFCGFYQFYITVHYCRTGCQACTNEIDCQNPSTVLSSTCQQINEYYDWHLDQCQKCPNNCQTCTSLQNCLTCKEGFINPIQGCVCSPNQYFDKNQQQCIQCSQNCDRCINDVICTQCDFLKFRILTNNQCICKEGYYDDNQNCLKCLQFCNKCTSENDCQDCIKGFSYNSNSLICERPANQYYVSSLAKFLDCPINTLCDPCNSNYTNCNCGDGIITEMEECDDMNNLANDRCYNCKLECQKQCTKCILGVCYECATSGWYLDTLTDQLICKEQCRDGIKVGTEKCDDAIESTKKIYCLECDLNQGLCLKCREGLSPESNYCKNICGDGIIVQAPDINVFEQCDDHNLSDDNDGCTSNCKFKCQIPLICDSCQNDICLHCVDVYLINSRLHRCECRESCLECDLSQGNGCLQCKIGYELRDKQCFTICGDEIVTLDEQCDDGNLIFDDGCHYCQYNCQDQCALCFKGICLKCFDNYLLIQEKCIKINYEDKILSQIDLNFFSYQSYDNQELQLYQFFEYNNYIKAITLQSLGLQDKEFMQQFEQLYFTYFKSFLIIDQNLDLFHQREDLIIDYLKDKQKNIIYTTCLQMDINCSSMCLSCSNQQCFFRNRDNLKQNCISIFGDGILAKNEQCNYLIQNYQETYINCKYNCPINCQYCHTGICINCSQGYYLDLQTNSCDSICGDKIITPQENCDDGNNIIYDGCTNCQFQCQETCTICQNGKCLSCIQSYFYDQKQERCLERKQCDESKGLYYDDIKNICVTKCGDQIKAGDEQCDDGNEQPNDGCNLCQFQCELLCKICIQGKCTECQEGYKNQNEICTSTCGDGIVLLSEQCDDGNNVSRDGCTQCIIDPGYQCIKVQETSICFICQSNCANCIYMEGNIKCTSCLKGYFLLENECITCSEQCEECEKTPNNCTKCRIEKCEKCNNSQGLYADYKLRKCVPKCGDNIKAGDEQCDDGNKQDKDGCTSFCEIEKGYECTRNICLKIPEKKVDVSFTNSSSDNNLVIKSEINFLNICSLIQININFFEPHEFNYNLTQFQINETSVYGCQIDFEFLKTISEINLIHLMIPLSNKTLRFLDEIKEIVITPRKQIFYNMDQKQQAQQIVSASNQFTFILQLIGPLTIFFGGLDSFWTILEILTWINYFYFFNIDYPLNVKQFFKQIQWDDIFAIPNLIELNKPTDSYYFQAPPKFSEKGVNPLFIQNIQVFCILLLISILIYALSSFIVMVFRKKLSTTAQQTHKIYIYTICYQQQKVEGQNYAQKKNQDHFQQKLQQLSKLSLSLFQFSYEYLQNFQSNLFSIVDLFILDIFMASLLQITCNYNLDHYILIINFGLALFTLIFIFYILQVYIYVSSKHTLLLKHTIYQRKFYSIYHSINFENSHAKKYCYWNIIRKAAFIFSLLYFYEKPLLQTILCCISCSINQAFLIFENPFKDKISLFKIGIPEFSIFCVTLLNILISLDDYSHILDFEQKYIIGWLIITLISLSIFVQILFLIQQVLTNLRSNLLSIASLLRG